MKFLIKSLPLILAFWAGWFTFDLTMMIFDEKYNMASYIIISVLVSFILFLKFKQKKLKEGDCKCEEK